MWRPKALYWVVVKNFPFFCLSCDLAAERGCGTFVPGGSAPAGPSQANGA